MQKEKHRIQAIEYMRGIGMLGVIGIHSGAYSLMNPAISMHLVALLDIVTRFCVPIFFFVSAFGLFINHDLTKPFNYREFMKRRSKAVLLPYIMWSFIYIAYMSFREETLALWNVGTISDYLAFGLACYQLYFLIILMWFYALMPLWRKIITFILPRSVLWLSILLVLQIVFNYYSSYVLEPDFSDPILNKLINYRLSYWVVHYIFIFLAGAVCALKYQSCLSYLKKHSSLINGAFAFTLGGMLIFYYYLILVIGYSPESAVNTAHQLSPMGVLYTLSATLFLLLLFSHNFSLKITLLLKTFAKHSYLIYLVHPLFMYLLIDLLTENHILMTEWIVIGFYLTTVALSLAAAYGINKISAFIPGISLCLTGSPQHKLKTGVPS